MPLKLRLFRETDIDFALSETKREGWDPTRETFEIHLAHDPEGCFIAVDGDDAVGMITTTRYEKTGWIGELIVTPESRGRGIGTLPYRPPVSG